MKATRIHHRLARHASSLLLLLALTVATVQGAWGQVKGDQYLSSLGTQEGSILQRQVKSIEAVTDDGKDAGSGQYGIENVLKEGAFWWTSTLPGTVDIVINFEQPELVSSIYLQMGEQIYERAVRIEVSSSEGGEPIPPYENPNRERELTLTLPNVSTQYLCLRLIPENESNTLAMNKLRLSREGTVVISEKRIQHKDPKWFDLREQLNLPEHSLGTFSYDRPRFDPISSSATDSIQAAHTYIDTIYMHKGASIDLELPTKFGNEANATSSANTYQRWYSYRTDGTFSTGETEEDAVWDLLTPVSGSGTAYRFANGYVGSPLSASVLQAMKFYYPTNEEFGQWFPQAEGNPNLDNDWYVVACDVSGYTDFTKDYPGSRPINTREEWASRFRDNGYYEPTLSVRVIFYIVGVDNRDNASSAGKAENWENGHGRLTTSEYQGGGTSGKYLEEYDITFSSKHLSGHTDELVALSKDAHSYAIPNVKENSNLTVSLVENTNTAGISLVTTSLSGAEDVTERIIKFRKEGVGANTPWEVEDGTHATILVTKEVTGGDGSTTTYNIARFNLTFEDNTVPLTQKQVAQLGTAEATGKDWNFVYRSPAWMRENLDSLTALTFNYDPTVADKYGSAGYQREYFPFPMEWEYSSYAFFDGSKKGDFISGESFVEWSYYAIVNDYIGYAESKDRIAVPPSGVGKDPDGHFLYVDTSDRPGIIARLPFDEPLCRGSELFVTAWLKSGASKDEQSDDAAVLFTVMGVNEDGSYTPLYRHSSSQIRRTDLLTAGDPGTGAGNNQWYQVYFSFMNNSDEAANFTSYVLQIENNSASTRGGDIYVDDIKVFIGRPSAAVTQKEYSCTNERTRMNIEMDWERLMSRLGGEGGTGENGFSFCFIDETDYNNYLASHPGSIAEAIVHSIVEIGDGEVINTRIMSMYFMNRFEDNDPVGTSTLPGNEGDNVADGDYFFAYQHMKDGKPYFYRTGSEDEAAGRRLTVDFYSVLSPNRPYIMLIIPATPEDGDGGMSEDDLIDYFATQMGDACSIQTRFYVESEAVIKVNGEVIDPSQTFCAGQVFNFSAQLRVPTGVDDEGNDTYDVLDEGVYFDWFFGTEEEFLAVDPTAKTSLQAALLDFRHFYPDATELDATTLPKEEDDVVFSQEELNLIERYVTSPVVTGGMHTRLVLHRENLDITLLNTGLQLVIQPIQTLVPPEGSGISDEQWAQICWNYIPVLLSVSGNAPQLHPGFNTVAYPADDFNPALRIGLKQIRETAVGGNGTALRMDLRGAVIITDGATHLGKIETSEGMDMLYLVDSDDPDYSNYFTGTDFNEYSLPIGQIEELRAEVYGSGSYNDYMTLRFDLSKQANDFQFAPKEGYTYTFSVHFEEKGEAEDEVYNSCYGSFNVRMKVVPEYLKWTGTALDNWNNDDHWQRLSGDELHYTSTDAEVRDHVTDGGINDNTKGFVPMLFSNVVMPTDSRAELYMAGYAQGGAVGAAWSWSGSDNRPEGMGDPTENIQYDLMVYEQNDRLTTQRYRVNICRDIHFMPGAQLLHAEQLIYNRAWTDVPVPAKRWTLISTPLQGVVAGDWYTTTKGTQANEPYFRDITFNDENDRLNPAVYQRSWDESATIVKQGGQTAPAHFSAAWSSVFNDARVPYVPGGGFSIKTAAAGSGDELLFRLPKADTEYKVSTGKLNREGAGKLLVTDLLDRSNPLVYSPKESVTAELTSSQDGKYLIVGNPFMAPLDLQKFFDGNTHLQPKYWTETKDGPAVGSADDESQWIETIEGATIPPYGAFFVEKAEGATGNTVSFTADMQTFGTATGETTGTNSLVVTAENASGRSRAALAYAYAATDGYRAEEDAQLIADLTGDGTAAPVVYTVAGDVAASVNRLHAQRQVPLGLFAAEEAQTLLTFSGVSALRNPRLYDAVAGTETPLAEGYTLTLAGASHGRYFLRSDGSTATGIGDEQGGDEARLTAYSVRRGEVIVSADVPLRTVQVYSVGGLLLDGSEPSADASVCRFDGLPSGVAVVRATMADGRTTAVKVAVQ